MNKRQNEGERRKKEIRSNFLRDKYHALFAEHAENMGLNVSQMTRFILMNYMRANDILAGNMPKSVITLTPEEKKQVA